MQVFIVGRMVNETWRSWEFAGVFGSEGEAIEACVDDTCFVGPAILGRRWPNETIEWPGAWYPLLENGGDQKNAAETGEP